MPSLTSNPASFWRISRISLELYPIEISSRFRLSGQVGL